MSLEKIARKIPSTSWEAASEKLIDIVLNSPKSKRMPSGLAKTILYYWQRDQLATEVGLERLLEATMIIDPEETINALNSLGLNEIVTVLQTS